MFKIILSAIIFFTHASFANQKKNLIPNEKIQSFFSSFKSIDGLLDFLKLDLPSGEVLEFRNNLISRNLDLSKPFAELKVENGKLKVGDNTIEVVDKGVVMLNGVSFKYNLNLTMSENFDKLLKTHNKQSHHLLYDLFVPKAHAITSLIDNKSFFTVFTLGAFILTGTIAYFGLIGTGVFYFGKEVYEYIKSGEVTCDDDRNFQVRVRKRNKALLASAIQKQIPAEEIKSLLQIDEAPKCTKELAKKVYERIMQIKYPTYPLPIKSKEEREKNAPASR